MHSKECLDVSMWMYWLFKVFGPYVTAHFGGTQLLQEVLLLIDNFSAHRTCGIKTNDGKIAWIFLLTNTPPLTHYIYHIWVNNIKINEVITFCIEANRIQCIWHIVKSCDEFTIRILLLVNEHCLFSFFNYSICF